MDFRIDGNDMDSVGDFVEVITDQLNNLGISSALIQDILFLVAVIGGVLLVRQLLLKLVFGRFTDVATQYQWRKITRYVAYALIFVLVLPAVTGTLRSTATYLGLLSAGLAVALQPLLVNMAGWMFILWRRPFRVGDRIEVSGHAGDVIDLRVFQFTLMEIGNWVDADQTTGRIVHIPNNVVFSGTLANYTRGFDYIWNELPVLVTFESDWKRAKAILATVAQQHGAALGEHASRRIQESSRRYYMLNTSFEPQIFTSVQDSGVLLSIRYLCDPRQRRASAQEMWEAILDAFAERPDIDFAYPTQRFITT